MQIKLVKSAKIGHNVYMTFKQQQAAFQIANNFDMDLSDVDVDIFWGCGLNDFKPVYVTLKQVARHMRWQALQMNGEWDSNELNEVNLIGKRKFLILDCE